MYIWILKKIENWRWRIQKKSHNYNKNRFDLHRKEYELDEADMVYVENGNPLNRKKLDEL